MEEQGRIISTCNIDDNLALQIWTRGKTPRLSIFNRNKNSRKLIHIAWVEKRDRTLTINAKGGGNASYVVQDFEPAIQKILAEYALRTNFKVKYFTLVIDLEKALHHPELISSPADLALMTEDKRSSLWLADCSGDDKKVGVFRPFFPVSDAEKTAMPDNKLKILGTNARGVEALIKNNVIADLKKANPERWHNTIRVTAAAMLLGFSYCGGDGTKTADALWAAGEKPKNLNPNVTVLKAPVKKLTIHDTGLAKLGHKLSAYIRHFYYIDKVNIEYIPDSEKELQERGYERSRRVDFAAGTLGDVPYRVTFFSSESQGMTALGCAPRMQTSRHTGHMVIIVPTEIYQQALTNDTITGSEDEFFTLTRLLWAKQYKDWYQSIMPYVKSFAGLINS